MKINSFDEIRVSYINDTRKIQKYSDVSLQQIVDDLRKERFAKGLQKLRALCADSNTEIMPEGTLPRRGDVELKLPGVPKVCFSLQMSADVDVRTIEAYNSLVMLQIGGLPDRKMAEVVRQCVASIPYTLLAFIGAECRTVMFVCRAQTATSTLCEELRNEDEKSHEKLLLFHSNAYNQLRKTYCTQLGMNVDVVKPELDLEWRMSADAEAYFNPDATPVVVDAVYRQEEYDFSMPKRGLQAIGMDYHHFCLMRYMSIVREAMSNCAGIKTLKDPILVQMIARECRNAGIPLDLAVKMTSYNMDINLNEDVISEIFKTTYLHNILFVQNEQMLQSSDMVGMKTRRLLEMHYDFRVNSITDEVQYRKRNLTQTMFRPLDKRARKTMCELAVDSGLGIWDKDVNRFLDSDRIEQYDPIFEFVDNLPAWDGVDRLTPLLQSITSGYPHMSDDLAIWIRSMMAQWMGRNSLYGNSIMPILIGPQGCGKTTFCKRLVPEALADYFNDQISFRNETNVNMALTRFALVVIDEFDSLSRGRHPQLKYLLTKTEVKSILPYGHNITRQRRIASFIATTNDPHPLTDQTGNRRFVCMPVKSIDNSQPINHPQFYAQIKEEVMKGKPSYFTDEDNLRIEKWNKRFMRVIDVQTMIANVFEKPEHCYNAPKMSLLDIARHIQKVYPNYQISDNSSDILGRKLKKMGYMRVRGHGCTGYKIALKQGLSD